MTLLKRFSGHGAVSAHIADYIMGAEGGRIRAAYMNVPGAASLEDWAHVMDDTRACAGNDRAYGSRRAVTYRHYIISPDPGSGAGPEACMELARAWAAEFFGCEFDEAGSCLEHRDGAYGNYEWCAVAHDDGANGIPHIHIVVNSTDTYTGRRLHMDNAQNDALWDRLQELSEERGLPAMPDARTHRKQELASRRARERAIRKDAFLTPRERRLIKEDGFCWKQQLRDLITTASYASADGGEFAAAMEACGVMLTETVNPKGEPDYIYAHPSNPARYRASGYRLGVNRYTREAVECGIARSHYIEAYERDPTVRKLVCAYIVRDVLREGGAVRPMPPGGTLAGLADMMRFNAEFRIRRLEDYRACTDWLVRRIELSHDEADKDRLRAAVDICRDAESMARVSGVLAGAEYAGRWSRFPPRAKPASSAGGHRPASASGRTGAHGPGRAPARDRSRNRKHQGGRP